MVSRSGNRDLVTQHRSRHAGFALKHLPPLAYIRSFEAAARHLSFTRAADELNLTQAAVSNHVRALEDFIGRPLFQRTPRSLVLTEVGSAYLPALRQALSQLDAATESILAAPRPQRVVVACPMSLAENWLPARIAGFRHAHPEIDVVIHGTIWSDTSEQIADLCICIWHEDQVSEPATKLRDETLAMICAPSLLDDPDGLRSPQDVARFGLIHVLGRQEFWHVFAQTYGVSNLNLEGGLKTDASNIALELAVQGLGCAVTLRSLAETYIRRGLLIEPFPRMMASPWSYYIRDGDAHQSRASRSLRTWLVDHARLI
jgi:LysR family transcriptional regulator, glycine cleavage system transcriptional activator